MDEKDIYSEYKLIPQFWAWIFIIFYSLIIFGFGMWVNMMVPDAPRSWDYGSLPDTPAESEYSTMAPSISVRPHTLVNPLPEGKPTPGQIEPEGKPEK